MTFSIFLKNLKEKYELKSTVELFNHLGGKDKLSMTIRNFSLLESGDLAPSIAAFSSIFRQLQSDEYRDAVLSYFNTNVEEAQNKELLGYLTNNLSFSRFKVEKVASSKSDDRLGFNSDQLSYLIENVEAMKLLNKIVLFKEVPKSSLTAKQDLVKKLKQLKLINEDRKSLLPTSFKYKLPSFSDSSSKNVRLASKLILNQIDTFISEEGTIKQTFAYAFHLLTSYQIKLINDEINRIKSLISDFAFENSESNVDSLIPYLFVGFGKEIEQKEFE